MTITALDSNVLLDIFMNDPRFVAGSLASVRRSAAEGTVIASEVVWAEVLAYAPDRSAAEAALLTIPVVFVPMDRQSARRAATAWGEYRRGGGPRTRIVSDFLVGAHALEHADRLLTRDRGFYRAAFGGLTILDPSRPTDRSADSR